jgi:hypothetical protein
LIKYLFLKLCITGGLFFPSAAWLREGSSRP